MENKDELNLEEMENVTGGAGLRNGEVEAEGTVMEMLPNAVFLVDISGQTVTAHVSGKLRMNYIKILPGDRVRVEYFPDTLHGRITWRCK